MLQTDGDSSRAERKTRLNRELATQSERLAQYRPSQEDDFTGSTQAAETIFITPLDPVVVTADGNRLPAIPVEEAVRFNKLKAVVDGTRPQTPLRTAIRMSKDGAVHGRRLPFPNASDSHGLDVEATEAPLCDSSPPSRTNPLFPPLPVYGPPSVLRSTQLVFFHISSGILSLLFLTSILVGAVFLATSKGVGRLQQRAMLQSPKKTRPFHDEEVRRAQERSLDEKAWAKQRRGHGSRAPSGEKGRSSNPEQFVATEGGSDKLSAEIKYYAQRVGLHVEAFEVQTEDGFILDLWHLINPREQGPSVSISETKRALDCSPAGSRNSGFVRDRLSQGNKRYPVLMIHGLLQSAGAFCCNDDDSLAFYLAKSGYDVWLGNNRCGFHPKHKTLHSGDPRMWSWNIRQMGVMDIPAFITKVLDATGFPKLALVAHSQGTTETFVALAKEQRPEIGEKISVFCALAPAAYAGPLIGKAHLKLMSLVSPAVFRLIFGIHAFIPHMIISHELLPRAFFSWLGYHVFSFLFNWSDTRWDRGLRNRMFHWPPPYVSAESMRWWLGQECFAKHKCILSTREHVRLEDQEDEEDDEIIRKFNIQQDLQEQSKPHHSLTQEPPTHQQHDKSRGRYAWYDERFPPLALWVCGADKLVDGRRLLRRFDRGREPHVRVIHRKVIEEYEHLDVIWALDHIDQVAKEVREVIWRTVELENQRECRVPVGCTRLQDSETRGLAIPVGSREIRTEFPKIVYGQDGDINEEAQASSSRPKDSDLALTDSEGQDSELC